MIDSEAWFASTSPADEAGLIDAIRENTTDTPQSWPRVAVERGFVSDEAEYYERLHEITLAGTREAVADRERADDQQLVHAIRAMDDCKRVSNELAERLSEWAASVGEGNGSGIEFARELAEQDQPSVDVPIRSLARRVIDLDVEATELRRFVEQRAPSVAPNLSALAGPVLAARVLSLAGSLESLAKMPSGTVQVLGAEEALFAHLRGHAPSPKHGIIFTHDAVRGTHPDERGSAARALAGKLTIAARIDHYSGDLRPELEAELADRIATIQARGEDDA